MFWSGQFVSLIGTWMQNTIQPLLAYQLTSQPIYLGLIGFATSLPGLLFTLPAGVLVEKIDKRKFVIFLQVVMMLQAFSMAYLTLSGLINIWMIIGLSFLLGLASAFEITARQSMVVELVSKKAIPSAIALNSGIFNTARVLGPSLTAPFLLLFQDQGIGWAFFANGVSYLFVILSLLWMESTPRKKIEGTRPNLFADFMVGQKYIRSSQVLFLLILIVTIPSFFGFPFGQLIPVFASDVLRGVQDSVATVNARNSLLMTAQGVGALLAAILLAIFTSIRRKGRLLVIGQVTFAAALVLFSFTNDTTIACLLLVFIGWGTITQLALTNTLIQLSVPDELRGRVISTYFWAQSAAAPFGSLLIGYLAENFNAPFAVRIGGIVCLVGYLSINFIKPAVRKSVV